MTSGSERDVINSQSAELRTEQTSHMVEAKEVIRDCCFGRDARWLGALNESSSMRVEQRCRLRMTVMSNGTPGGMGLERTSYLVVAIMRFLIPVVFYEITNVECVYSPNTTILLYIVL